MNEKIINNALAWAKEHTRMNIGKKMGILRKRRSGKKASECLQCGACEKRCPFEKKSERMKWVYKLKSIIANLLTSCRIILSLIMLLFPAFSLGFCFCYFVAGITDMLDGMIARKLRAESEFGEKLDTIADSIFVISVLYKLLPVIEIGVGIWVWIGVIAVLKIINIISGFVTQKRFIAVHSRANKITGLMLFVLPFSVSVIDIKYSAIAVCLLATFAAIQEGHYIRTKVFE